MKSKKNEASADEEGIEGNDRKRLIEALETFIVQLTHGSRAYQEDKVSELTSETTNLLDALHSFVLSVSAKRAPPEVSIAKHRSIKSVSGPVSPAAVVQRSPLLEQILAKARYRVFNRMPVRMLAFNKDGTGIRLVERPEVLRIISERIELNFYMDTNISQIDPESNLEANYAIEQFLHRHCAYAILSHTWLRELPGEVTFTDWTANTFDPQLNGYRKLEMFCRVSALNHGLTLGWMDTCCIDKSSSAELDESIRCMFRWYEWSAVCIIYLADTMTLEDMHKDTWFSRGWTLQELVSPKISRFYRRDWECLSPSSSIRFNDKDSQPILQEVHKATTITQHELNHPFDTDISRRMQWAAERCVTREEDTAYSLMGIFNVSFSTAYGEGAEVAFGRLIQEILKSEQRGSGTLSIVNWGNGNDGRYSFSHSGSRLIPESPKYYAHRAPDITWHDPYEPIVLTPLGLRVSVLVMPALRAKSAHPKYFTPRGDYYATANILGHFDVLPPSSSRTANEVNSSKHGLYNVLDNRLFDADGNILFTRPAYQSEDSKIHIFGMLNFVELETSIL